MLQSSIPQVRTPTLVARSWLNLSGPRMRFWPILRLARSFAAPDVTTFFAGFRIASFIRPWQMNFVLLRWLISDGGLATGQAANNCWYRVKGKTPNPSVNTDAPVHACTSASTSGGAPVTLIR